MLPSFSVDWNLYNDLTQASRELPEDVSGLLVTKENDWNSVFTYYVNRKMLLISYDELKDEKINKKIKEGYSFVMIYGHEFKDDNDILPAFKKIYSQESVRLFSLLNYQ